MKYLSHTIGQFFLVAFALLFGLGLGQFPQFLAQYLQRLGGHIDEARLAAQQFNMEALTDRADGLEASLHSIENAPALMKLPVFLSRADWDIVDRALDNYTMGMTFDRLGLWYCITGALIGILLFNLLRWLISKIFRRKKGNESL